MSKRKEKKAVIKEERNLEVKENPNVELKEELKWSFWEMRHNEPPDFVLQKLASDLREWCKTEDAYKLSQFYVRKEIGHDTFYAYMKRCPELKAAADHAMIEIGNRREIMGLQRKLDPGMVSYTMAMYDKKWKELAEWKASLQRERQLDGNVRVQVEQVPNSDKVPEKKNE